MNYVLLCHYSGSVSLMMMNLNDTEVRVSLEDDSLVISPRDVYWLSPPRGNLTST